MPEVKPGETRSEYMARCVPIIMQEGKNRDAAVGKCEGMFDSHHKKKAYDQFSCDPGQLVNQDWAIDPVAHQQYLDVCLAIPLAEAIQMGNEVAKKEPPPKYHIDGRVAIIPMSGPLTKKTTSFDPVIGGGSTVRAREALRAAAADSRVDRILMSIESPGGTVAGTKDLYDAVRKTDQSKPVYTHFNDVGGSAAYWVGLGGRQVSANANAQIGSIGAYTVLQDQSGKLDKAGIKLHVISSGKFKGPVEGITEAQLGEMQTRIGDIADLFMQDVAAARKMPLAKVKEVGDGRAFIASKAKELGLIDKICNQEDLVAELNRKTPTAPERGRSDVMPYTQEQLTKARSLPSLAAITEEGAETAVLNAAVSLNSRVNELAQSVQSKDTEINQLRSKVPAEVNSQVLQGFSDLASGEIELMAAQGKLLPGQVLQLKAFVAPNGQPNATMLMGINGQPAPYKAVLKAFEGNKPNGIVGETTPGQPAARTEPGAHQAAGGKEEFPTYERWNEIRVMAKYAPGSKDDYEKAKMGIH